MAAAVVSLCASAKFVRAADEVSPILNSTTYDRFLSLNPHLNTIYTEGTTSDLDRYLRSLVSTPEFDISKLDAKVRHAYGESGLLIPVDSDELRVVEFNKSLANSGIHFVKFQAQPGKSSVEPVLSSSFSAWMWVRKLSMPTAVFVAAYAIGIYELPKLESELGITRPLSSSDFMAPAIAGGIAGAVLSAIYEFPRKWWNEEVFGTRLGPLYQGIAFLLTPMAIRATEILTILRPWDRDVPHSPLSTAFILPSVVSAVAAMTTVGYVRWQLDHIKKRSGISMAGHFVIESLVTLFASVGQIIYLTGQNPVPGLSLLGATFLFGSLPLWIREVVGKDLYENLTAHKAWSRFDPSRAPMSGVRKICAKVLGSLSMSLSPSPKIIRDLSAE